jgi:hypothetical protein
VRVWDLRAPGCQREYGSRAAVNTVVLHPNQGELISGALGVSHRVRGAAQGKERPQCCPRSAVARLYGHRACSWLSGPCAWCSRLLNCLGASGTSSHCTHSWTATHPRGLQGIACQTHLGWTHLHLTCLAYLVRVEVCLPCLLGLAEWRAEWRGQRPNGEGGWGGWMEGHGCVA